MLSFVVHYRTLSRMIPKDNNVFYMTKGSLNSSDLSKISGCLFFYAG